MHSHKQLFFIPIGVGRHYFTFPLRKDASSEVGSEPAAMKQRAAAVNGRLRQAQRRRRRSQAQAQKGADLRGSAVAFSAWPELSRMRAASSRVCRQRFYRTGPDTLSERNPFGGTAYKQPFTRQAAGSEPLLAAAAMVHQKRVTPAELEAAGKPKDMVARLKTGTMEVKESVSRLIAALCTQDSTQVEPVVKADAIKPLVELVAKGSENGQLHGASALAAIAENRPEVQQKIVEAGGIEPIVALLRMGSAGTQEQAIKALASVSEDRQHQEAILKTGALKNVTSLLKGGKGNTTVFAAASVANLTADNAKAQQAFVEMGGLPLLLTLLQSGKEQAQVHAARAVAKVSGNNREVQDAIHEQGGIPSLLVLLNGRNIEATVQSASAIAEVARENSDTQNAIAKAGGIGPLLAMLPTGKAQPQSQASSALAQLARHNRENQDSMARMDALSLLAVLLAGDNAHEVQSFSAMAVAEICRENPDNQTTAADLGMVASMVVLLRQSTSHEVKTEAAGAIWVLSDRHDVNKVSFASAGAIKPLVHLLGTKPQRGTDHAANALAAIAFENVENLKQVTSLLVDMLGYGDLEAKSKAAASLWRLVQENPTCQHDIASAGSAADLVHLLKAGSADARSYSLWSLSLSINPDNQSVVLESGGVKPLVAALGSLLEIEREQGGAALARLAKGNAEAQLAITKGGAVSPLVEMLDADTNSPTAQEFGAATIAELSLLSATRDSFVACGSITPLVALLREGRNDGKKFAASALARIAHDQDETAADIARAGAVSPLVTLLNGDRGPEAQEEAAGALYELAANAENRMAITDCDGIGPLVSLLGSSNVRTREHAEGGLVRLSIENSNRVLIIKQLVGMLYGDGKEQAAAALANLASDSDGNRVSIVQSGGIKPLLMLLDPSSSSKEKENAMMALKHLAYHNEERQNAIADAGGIPMVVDVLLSSTSNVKDIGAIYLSSLSADAVGQIGKGNPANQLALAEAGAIGPLVAMLGSPTPEMQSTAALAISSLSRDSPENQAAIARTGAIAPLCTNVRDGATAETKEGSASALWSLATDNAPNKATIAKLGGIEPLVSLLVSGSSLKGGALASGALAGLSAKNSENRVAIAKRLISLLSSRVAERAERVLRAISDMCMDNVANQIAIAKASGIQPLITWMSGGLDKFGFSAEAQREAARAVLSVSSNNPTTQQLVAKFGGIPQLIELVRQSSKETQELAARVLWHIASNQEHKMLIAEGGGIKPLVTMLSVDDVHSQELAAVVISRLARRSNEVSSAVAEVDGIPPLIKLIRENRSPTAQLQAATAIAEVSSVPDNRDLVCSAGGIGPLVQCLSSTVVGIPETAALAIARLARDDFEFGEDGGAEPDELPEVPVIKPGAHRRLAILKAGGVSQLVKMLEKPSIPGTAKRMWAMIADVMGISASKSKGSEDDGAVSNMHEHQNIGVQEQVAATLCDLTYGDVVIQDAVIAEDAISNLLVMIRLGSELGQEYAARVIWHLCASVHNQGTVVDQGTIVDLVALSRTGSEKAQELSAAVISDLARGAILERERELSALKKAGVVETAASAESEALRAEEIGIEMLVAALNVGQNKKRVIDIFRELDKDGDGVVTKQEFEEKMEELGDFDGHEGEVKHGLGMLFETIDTDGGGTITYKELNKKLRAGNAIALAKELQVGALGEIALESKNQIALREADGSAPKVEASAPSAAPPAEAPASTSKSNNKDRLSAIASAGGIYPLVGLVTNGSLMGKERAAGALWHLSVDAVNRMIIAKAGGIAPLVQLLDDGTLQAQIHVAEALGRLAMNSPDNQAQIAKKLVGLIATNRPGAQQRAAHTLWELGLSNSGAPIIIVNAGAISPLVTLLSTGVSEAKREAAGALSTLALNEPSNQLAIATGLVALLGSGSAEAQEHVTSLLLSLATDADNRVAIAKAGAVQRLILQIRNATSIKAQELAAAALSHLTGDSDANVRKIHSEDGIQPLVELLTCESPEAQAHAAAVLSDMTRVFRNAVHKQGAMEPLVKLLSDGDTSDIKAEAAGALWSLSGGTEIMQTAIAHAGAIPSLVGLLYDPSMRTRRKAAGALTSLAIGNHTNQDAIARAKGIAPLVDLIGDAYDSEVQLYAAGALAELARNHRKNQDAIAKAGSIKPLVKLLEVVECEGAPLRAKEEAAGALWTLSSKSHDNQVGVADAGGISPLVALLDVNSLRAQEKAAGALSALALDNPVNKTAISSMLVGMLNPKDWKASAKGARAIARVACAHPNNQEAIATAGGITVLVGLLRDGAAAKPGVAAFMQKQLSAALWSMAMNNEANQTAIAEAGGIPLLIELLEAGTGLAPSPTAEVHGDACGALWALAALDSNKKIIADEKGIRALVILLKLGSDGARETSAGALAVLAQRPENRKLVSEAKGIPLLVALLEIGSPEAKIQAAGAMQWLVQGNTVNQSAVARELVAMLSSANTSLLAQEHVARLLRNLALDPENRASIASAGAVPQLAKQLRDGLTGGQEMAAGALSQLALKSATIRVQVTQELVGLLGSNVAAVRGRAAEALRDMNAEAGADARMSIAMAGGIDRFVHLLKDGSVEAQEYAIWSLWQATDVQSKVSIAEADCAMPIINCLITGKLHEVANEHAAAVLCGLTSVVSEVPAELSIKNMRDIVASGGIPPLISLLRKGNSGAKYHAALALAQLSTGRDAASNASTALEVTEKGAVSAFIEWLVDPSLGPPEMAARALAHISQDNSATQTTIAEEGAIPLLVALVGADKLVEQQKYGAAALAALAEGHVINQIIIAEEGGVKALVELIRCDTVAPHENATRAIWHISANADNKLSVARAGGIEALVLLLSNGSELGQEWAAAAIESITRDCPENQVRQAAIDGIGPLVALLGAESEVTQDNAVHALLNISMANHDNRTGVVKPLVDLLSVRNAAASMKAAQALMMLAARSHPDRQVISDANAIPPLVAMLGDGRNATTPQIRAAAVLSDLARTGENKAAVVKAGGVTPLVKMLSTAKNEVAQVAASGAVAQLTANTIAQKLITEAGGVYPLVSLLSSTSMEAARHAADALWHLEANSDNKGVVIKAGAIPPLVILMRRFDSPLTQEAAAHVIADLSRHNAGSKAISTAGGIPSLVGLLKWDPKTAATARHAASALWGLTSGSPGQTQWPQIAANIAAVAKTNAVSLLLTLVAKSALGETTRELVGYAVATLNNVVIEEAARSAILENGGIDILTQQLTGTSMGGEGLQVDHPWLKEQGVSLLRNLGVTNPDPGGPVKPGSLNMAAMKDHKSSAKPSARPGTGTSRPHMRGLISGR